MGQATTKSAGRLGKVLEGVEKHEYVSKHVNQRILPVVRAEATWDASFRPKPDKMARRVAVASSRTVDRLVRKEKIALPPIVSAYPPRWSGRSALGKKSMVVTVPALHKRTLDFSLLVLGVLGVAGSVGFWMSNRDVVGVTGRERTMAIGKNFEKQIGAFLYEQVLDSEEIVSRSDARSIVLKKIFSEILVANGEEIPMEWDWELTLCESPTINAFTSLGGKLCFYSGLLHRIGIMHVEGKVSSVQDAVAAVIAHEQGHAIARHVAEAMSWLPIQIPFFFFSYKSPLMEAVFQYYINLPFSRQNEFEADTIGLNMMSKAGFSPEVARDFHLALNTSSVFQEFSHTHPVGASRAKQIETIMPVARKEYLASKQKRERPVTRSYANILLNELDEGYELLMERDTHRVDASVYTTHFFP